ncbi:MAG: hypothetical protein WC936_04075, partial [Candidatus Nanoarchaeia archaeon]
AMEKETKNNKELKETNNSCEAGGSNPSQSIQNIILIFDFPPTLCETKGWFRIPLSPNPDNFFIW